MPALPSLAVAQNVYDDEAFFAAYSALSRSVDGFDTAPEWPVVRGMLPDVSGLDVVDLGCGFGGFARWAAANGAASVLGVDLSDRMLERARRETADGRIAFERADLDHLDDDHLPAATFDLAHSSLAVHYLVDWERFVGAVHRALRPGGSFVFSAEHPIVTAPSTPGFVSGEAGRTVWPVDRYHAEGERITDWLTPGVVKQHRRIDTYVGGLLAAGFALTGLVEWGPTPEQLAARPEWSVELDRPMFLIVAATT